MKDPSIFARMISPVRWGFVQEGPEEKRRVGTASDSLQSETGN